MQGNQIGDLPRPCKSEGNKKDKFLPNHTTLTAKFEGTSGSLSLQLANCGHNYLASAAICREVIACEGKRGQVKTTLKNLFPILQMWENE